MKRTKTYLILTLLFGMLLGSVSCTPAVRLNTRGVQETEVAGNYTVIYYGCNYFDDLETIAFLAKEDGKYTFEPYAPDFQYRVKKGLSAKEALDSAIGFVNCNSSFTRAQVSGILGPDGATIGYEVRPLYQPFTYGAGDFLFVNYGLRDGKVIINVRLPQELLDGSSGTTRNEK